MFEKVEFYRVDIQLLRDLGHEVVLAGSPRNLDKSADLYFCWWWGHSPYALALGFLRRKPVVVTGAFDYLTCREEIPGLCYVDRPFWQKLVLQSALRIADRNLFISEYEYHEVNKNLKVKNPVLAPLAVDTNFYSPIPTHPFKSDYFFSVSWTSRTNVIRKGVQQTIEAFSLVAAENPGIRLVLAGKPGDYEPALKNLVRQLGIQNQVEFIGLISDEEKLHHYRNCIAYVQPTLYEAFGLAMAEAVASGCPVITSNRGAVPEVVGTFGHIIDPYDIGSIARAMRSQLNTLRGTVDECKGHAWIESMYSLAARRKYLEKTIAEVTLGK
jgi:glycosyltransferase involved in cell wall biosynthesis